MQLPRSVFSFSSRPSEQIHSNSRTDCWDRCGNGSLCDPCHPLGCVLCEEEEEEGAAWKDS